MFGLFTGLKAKLYMVIGVVIALFTFDYKRRGRKIDKQKEEINKLEAVDTSKEERKEIKKETKEKVKEARATKDEDVTDSLNDSN